MFYDKKIKYLNYIVDGERLKGCGFAKIEIRENSLNLEVAVSGLPPLIHVYTDVWLCTKDATYSLGQICLENGRGIFRLCNCSVAEISPMGVKYDDWKGIAVFPDESCEISTYWQEETKCRLERVEIAGELTGEIVESGISEAVSSVMPEMVKPETVLPEIPKAVEKAAEETTQISERSNEEEAAKPERKPEQLRMEEDKWEQISGIYPHIRPFRDKREYLSIRPADFVLFSEESYKAVNNSFLLHGYHNYQHLILARSLKRGEVTYYVGTPGNFFHREKQVAIMFGFSGFECAKDPAGEGDFGYYLMEVQL